jgi:hypothetical protein
MHFSLIAIVTIALSAVNAAPVGFEEVHKQMDVLRGKRNRDDLKGEEKDKYDILVGQYDKAILQSSKAPKEFLGYAMSYSELNDETPDFNLAEEEVGFEEVLKISAILEYYRDISVELSNDIFLEDSRGQFPSVIEEIETEFSLLQQGSEAKELASERDAVMLQACVNWAKKNQVWITHVPCPKCSSTLKVCDSRFPLDKEYQNPTAKEYEDSARGPVEMLYCNSICNSRLRFPRYTSRKKLLETKLGRYSRFPLDKEYQNPTAKEYEDSARGPVEMLYCNSICNSRLRFPRYTSLKKLLETKVGRCGEMARIFAFITTLMGLKGRIALDLVRDHAWNEVMVSNAWVPVDIPKKLKGMEEDAGMDFTWVLAFENGQVIDVTGAYAKSGMADVEMRRGLIPIHSAAARTVFNQ